MLPSIRNQPSLLVEENKMECIKSLEFEEQEKEIAFDDLEATDSILIQTQNSTYHFSVVDPSQRLGMLSGGPVADHLYDAILAASLTEDDDGFTSYPAGVRTELRALFYIRIENQWNYLITSVITGLFRTRPGSSASQAALSTEHCAGNHLQAG
jgi:hypothetical protein